MTFILHLIRWQGLCLCLGLCLGSARCGVSFWVYLKDSKIRQLYCRRCRCYGARPCSRQVWRAYANCGNKTVKISMPVAGDGNGNGNWGRLGGVCSGAMARRVDSQTICWNKFEIEWNCQKHFAHFATASDAKKKTFFPIFFFLLLAPPLGGGIVAVANLSQLILLHLRLGFALHSASYGFNKSKKKYLTKLSMCNEKHKIINKNIYQTPSYSSYMSWEVWKAS